MGDEQTNQQASEARAAPIEREAAQQSAEEWKAAWYEIGTIARYHGCPDLAVTTVHRWLDARLRALEQAERERDALRPLYEALKEHRQALDHFLQLSEERRGATPALTEAGARLTEMADTVHRAFSAAQTALDSGAPAEEMNDHIRLYAWRDAPANYQNLSGHGGDEDWVLVVPAELRSAAYWPWGISQVIDGEEGSYLDGFGHVDRHELPAGDLVIIFAHA